MIGILQIIYLLLPAAVANIMPVVVGRAKILRWLAIPIDIGAKLKGKALFGKHKTWRGLASGIVAGVLVAWLQSLIGPTPLDVVDYSVVWLPLGLLLGTGALIGDMVKSLLKRQRNIKEGSPWVPFDQIDFAIGALIFAYPIIWLGWPASFTAVVLLGAGHVIIVWIGYIFRWRKSKW